MSDNPLAARFTCAVCGQPKMHSRLRGYHCRDERHNEQERGMELEQAIKETLKAKALSEIAADYAVQTVNADWQRLHTEANAALHKLSQLVIDANAHHEDVGQTAEQALSALAIIAEEIMRKSDKENAE